ncbi:MAG: hypothetical protein V1909_06230 [Candidatus Micrarchaeota archaeon]
MERCGDNIKTESAGTGNKPHGYKPPGFFKKLINRYKEKNEEKRQIALDIAEKKLELALDMTDPMAGTCLGRVELRERVERLKATYPNPKDRDGNALNFDDLLVLGGILNNLDASLEKDISECMRIIRDAGSIMLLIFESEKAGDNRSWAEQVTYELADKASIMLRSSTGSVGAHRSVCFAVVEMSKNKEMLEKWENSETKRRLDFIKRERDKFLRYENYQFRFENGLLDRAEEEAMRKNSQMKFYEYLCKNGWLSLREKYGEKYD